MAAKNSELLSSAQQAAKENKPSTLGVDPRWTTATIQEVRWNQNYPYQLHILEKVGGGYVVKETFTLPINPQSMNITTPFAIETSASLGGIVEEHNGAPFRNITLQGTTGVLPLRGSAGMVQTAGPLEAIFSGTVRAIKTTVSALAAVPGASSLRPNVVKAEEIAGDLKGTTGYYQFHLLQQFLESYVALKKTQQGRPYRLAFSIWKDQETYLVTPVAFDRQRSAQDPDSYNFTIQLRAWRRYDLATGPAPYDNQDRGNAREPSKLAEALNTLRASRRAVQSLKGVVNGIRGDIKTVLFEPLRESILFIKDALGVVLAVSDLPVNIIRDMKAPILEAASTVRLAQSVQSRFDNLGSDLSSEYQKIVDEIQSLAVSSSKAESGSGSSGGGLDLDPASPAHKILDNPDDHPELFDAINVSDLNLPPDTVRKIIGERDRVRKLNRLDYEKIRDNLEILIADLADACGAGDPTYNEIMGRPAPSFDKEPTDDDYEMLFSLNQLVMEFSRLSATGEVNNSRRSVMEYVAGLAGRSGIRFDIPRSHFQVPFPYGSTLEMLAARYLGDPQRWHEIATLNRLREPYVDEEGFDLPLMVNGSKNRIQVSSVENLYIGQYVSLASNTASRTWRHITDIEDLGNRTYVVSLDGDPDLASLKVADEAALHAFLPDTVNSQKLISIPSSDASPIDDLETKEIRGLDEIESLLNAAGVDLLLTQDNDAAITANGDWPLAIGITKMTQDARIYFSTEKNSLLYAKGFGIDLKPGTSSADLSADDLLQSAQGLLQANPAFKNIARADVLRDGNSVRISFELGVAGTESLLPISFDLT